MDICIRAQKKNQSGIWVFQNEVKPTEAVCSCSVWKMIVSFVYETGHVATVSLEYHRTVDADWYTTICLHYVIAELLLDHWSIDHHWSYSPDFGDINFLSGISAFMISSDEYI